MHSFRFWSCLAYCLCQWDECFSKLGEFECNVYVYARYWRCFIIFECDLFMSALLVQKLNCYILFFHCLTVPDKYLLLLVFSFVLNSFKNFDLEESQKCAVDWLMIGPSSKREEYKVCGSSIPPSFISARDHVWIFFHSDASSSGQSQGFRLSYIRGKTLQFCWLCLSTLVKLEDRSIC